MRTDYHRLKVSNDFCSGLPQQGDNVVFCLISPLRAHVFRRKDLFVIFLDLFAEKTNEKMLFCSVLLQKELRFFVSVQVELQTLKKKKLQLVLAALLNIAEYPQLWFFVVAFVRIPCTPGGISLFILFFCTTVFKSVTTKISLNPFLQRMVIYRYLLDWRMRIIYCESCTCSLFFYSFLDHNQSLLQRDFRVL